MILAQRLAVIVDIHPADEFKLRLKDDRQVENFVKFWRALAEHLSQRDPEMVFLETINEPMVEDPYRWYGIQAKLIAAMRAGAPKHTIIASGHRWSGLAEMLALEPYSDPNIIYNFHYYDPFPFTHQGANWAGPNLQFYRHVPYPSSPESVAKILDTIADEPARLNLVHYGQDRWNAERIDRDISMAAEWGARHHVLVTCNEFGAYRAFSNSEDRVRWITDMRTVLERHGIGWTMWDYAGGFSVVNKANGHATPDTETVKALGLGR
jgi:aryl-phospho-beta-D-glucosidase BglC (GH1 family)